MRVLVTRPEPGASETARRLTAMGHEPAVLPLTEIRRLDLTDPPDARDFDAVVATSGAALRSAPPALLASLLDLPLFAVGDATAEAARKAGFARAESASGDSPALAAQVVLTLPEGSRIVYLCGRVRTGDLAERLRKAGFAVATVETYDTLPIEFQSSEIGELLEARPVDAVLLYSANAAVLFARLLASREAGPLVRAARLLCMSARAAQALPESARARSEIARTPDEPALLRLLAG